MGRSFILLLLVLLPTCGGGGGSSSSSTSRVSISQEQVIWEGYANQREDFFDIFHRAKDCLKSFGNEPVRDGYPYVVITNKMIACPVNLCFGCAEGLNVYVCDKSPEWVYTHEFIHFIMDWSDESRPEFLECIQVSSAISCPTGRSENGSEKNTGQ